MPRFTNTQLIPRPPTIKKKFIPGQTKYGSYRKKNIHSYKNMTENRKKLLKQSRILKFGSQDFLGYPLFPNEDNQIPSNIFGYTQKRHCCLRKQGEDKVWEEGPRIAIVGAGVAGLSAANHLASNGFNNFHLFEATSRLGGRVNTAKFSDGETCELGAEWLARGDISNGLVLLGNLEGIMSTSNIDWRYNRHIICMTSEGRALSSDLCAIGRKIFNKVRKELYRLYRAAADFKHGTLAYFLERRLSEELMGFSDTILEHLQRLMCCLKNDLRIRWGAELGRMSSDLIGAYADEPGDAVRLKGGLVNALLPLVRKIPEEKIHLNSPVKTVFWGFDKSSVVLEDNKEIPADHIIVTVPLGFLKKNYDQFFHPKLPRRKVEAIQNLGYGNVTKIYMKYPNDIWGSRRTEISTLWKSRDWSDRETYWYKGISCVNVQGDVTSLTIGGPEAVYAEEETTNLIAHDLTSLLRSFLGAAFLPLPKELVRSRWNTDPWNHGSGTYMSLDSQPNDPITLSEPLILCGEKLPKVMFAGEATCPKMMNTVSGARRTGVREAQRILDFVSKTPPLITCDPCFP